MNDKKIYTLVTTCLIVSLVSVGFTGFTYYNRASRSKTTDTSTNKPIPPDLNRTYWDNWRKADSVSDYQKILNQASRYEHNPSSWHSPPNVSIGQGFGVGPYDYVVFQGDKDNYYAKSGDNGQIMFEGSNASTVVQNAVNSLSKGTVYLKGFDRPSGVTTTENVAILTESNGNLILENGLFSTGQLFIAGDSLQVPAPTPKENKVWIKPRADFSVDFGKEVETTNYTDPEILHRSNFDDGKYRILIKDYAAGSYELWTTKDFQSFTTVDTGLYRGAPLSDVVVHPDGDFFAVYGTDNTYVKKGTSVVNMPDVGQAITGGGDGGIYITDEKIHYFVENSDWSIISHWTAPLDDPTNTTKQGNPINVSYHTGDPVVNKIGDYYYMFADHVTGDVPNGSDEYHTDVWMSPDLYSWTRIENAITLGENIGGDMVVTKFDTKNYDMAGLTELTGSDAVGAGTWFWSVEPAGTRYYDGSSWVPNIQPDMYVRNRTEHRGTSVYYYKSDTQSIPSGSRTLVGFSQAKRDTLLETGDNQVTLKYDGDYRVTAHLAYNDLSAGSGTTLQMFVYVNTDAYDLYRDTVGDNYQAMHGSIFLPNLSAGDNLYIEVYQDSGESRTLRSGSDHSYFIVNRVGGRR